MANIWSNDKMKDPVKTFLEENQLIPINKNWNFFQTAHSSSIPPKDKKKEIKKYIAEHVGDRPGLYAYYDESGCLLYVGKARKLLTRIFSHYCESFCEIKENDKAAAWPAFFSKHCGDLKVYWIEIQYDRPQRIVEEMIEYYLQSQFDKEFPRGKRKIKKKLPIQKTDLDADND
ncbi:MAG: hypothetical protein ABI462_04100 [Ignavibacteria bacterium]